MSAAKALVVAALSLTVPCAALSSGLGGINVPVDARMVGGGNASIAAGGPAAHRYNPGLLAFTEGLAGTLNGGPMYLGIEGMDSALVGVAGAWRASPEWGLGANLVVESVDFMYVDEYGRENHKIDYFAMDFGLSAAYSFGPLGVGLTLRGVRERIIDDGMGGFASDLGVVFRNWGLTAGLSVRNLGPDIAKGDKELQTSPVNLPTETRFGAAYAFPGDQLTAGFEFAKTTTAKDKADAGLAVSWWPARVLGLRAGMSGLGVNYGTHPTFGLSTAYRDLGFDLGVALHPMGTVVRAGLSYAMPTGKGMAETAPPREERREPPPPAETVPAGIRLNFAVADLSAQGVSASDSAVIADLLRSELVKTGVFNVIEKQNMDKVLSEHAFQQTGCTSEECAVKLGKLLNVQRMAVGSFGKLLDSYFLNIRVVNVETGQIGFADSVEGRTVSELRAGLKDLAARMARQVR